MMDGKRLKQWNEWLTGWDRALEDAGYTDPDGDNPLPIYDVAEHDMATLAIEKLQAGAFEHDMSPEDAVVECEDRDKFAATYYDPYIEEFEEELAWPGPGWPGT